MVVEQEDEEEKVRWRVDAEVRLAREELQASSSSDKVGHSCHSPFSVRLDIPLHG